MTARLIPAALAGAQFVPTNGKRPIYKNWPDTRLSLDEAEQRLARGGDIAIRPGVASGHIIDIDLDCTESLALADIYLPPTAAVFGRPSKPRSHRLYLAPDAVFAVFADPVEGKTLIELRADGRDGGAHLTTIPPSITDGERRKWHGAAVEPAAIEAAVLARRMAWLAVGCLIMRHVSEHAARRPGRDLPSILWEADPVLGRAAYRWLREPAPDEVRSATPRRHYTPNELRLEEIVAAIPNNCSWEDWNRVGLAIFAASGGSELGFLAFDDFSARSAKYDPHAVLERWRNYRRSPPNRISLGTLVYLAREAGWRASAA